jgi:hypothetical protein
MSSRLCWCEVGQIISFFYCSLDYFLGMLLKKVVQDWLSVSSIVHSVQILRQIVISLNWWLQIMSQFPCLLLAHAEISITVSCELIND